MCFSGWMLSCNLQLFGDFSSCLCQLSLYPLVVLGKDVRLTASLADAIAELKKQLEKQEDIDVSRQRWFFSGKLLTDKTRLQDAKIQKDFVVQVIVNMNPSVIAN